MKPYYLLLLVLLLCSNKANGTVIPLDTIKYAVVKTLVVEERMEPVSNINEFANWLIIDVINNKPIEQGAEGIFKFWDLSEHSFTHLVLIEKEKYYIINMRKDLEGNLHQLLLFLEKSCYSKSLCIKYIKCFLTIQNWNQQHGIIW